MTNYINLPESFKNFIKIPDNLTEIVPDFEKFNWIRSDTDLYLTKEGQAWFASKNLVIRPSVALFSIRANDVGEPHIDNTDYAFNFVVHGYGQMQWVEVEGDENSIFWSDDIGGRVAYTSYENIKNINVIDTWEGTMALVKTGRCHRIVTSDSRRICLSIRMVTSRNPRTFEEIAKILES